jgi:hypothetical protein
MRSRRPLLGQEGAVAVEAGRLRKGGVLGAAWGLLASVAMQARVYASNVTVR